MRIAVFGGSGFIGARVCKALIACGCAVTSISRSGDAALGSRFEGEPWVQQVNWMKADASVEGAATAALAEADGLDGVVSCIGKGDLLLASDKGWNGRWAWTQFSRDLYAANALPNTCATAAGKEAGAKRFVYVGVGSECQKGFGGPNPGLYTGKRDAALAGRDAFGDQFTFFGPHAVVESKDDPRIKAANSGFGKGLNAVNDFFGEIRSFGPDYATKTKLAAPVPVDDLALAIAASVIGKVEVEETMRAAGVTTLDATKESEQYEIRDMMRHVDGTAAISDLAARAQREGMTV